MAKKNKKILKMHIRAARGQTSRQDQSRRVWSWSLIWFLVNIQSCCDSFLPSLEGSSLVLTLLLTAGCSCTLNKSPFSWELRTSTRSISESQDPAPFQQDASRENVVSQSGSMDSKSRSATERVWKGMEGVCPPPPPPTQHQCKLAALG